MEEILSPENLLIRLPIVLLALTVHEFAHAYTAWRMGDPTALRMGRCTLNPLKHLEPLGTICLMFAWIGWAKPVPVNPLNFRDRRMGSLLTSAAGPGSNIAQAVMFALLLRGLMLFADHWAGPGTENFLAAASTMFLWGVYINVALAVFNCLPVYPLDGFHITLQLAGPDLQRRMLGMVQYGPFIIIGLVVFSHVGEVNLLGRLMFPPANMLLKYVAGL